MTQGHEIHFRNSMFGPSINNPAAGNLPGAIVFEGFGNGRCNCQFTDNYPFALGPRLGAAYQFNEKTVLRAGAGIIYSNLPTLAYLTNAAILGVGFDQQVWSNPGYAEPSTLLKDGLPVNLTQIYTPTLDPGLRPRTGQLDAPGTMFDRNGARPGRVVQWNLSLQREVVRGLVVEAAYVGNRSSWLNQNNIINPNALSDQTLSRYGLSRDRPADLTLLASRIDSAGAIARGFVRPYASFPASATVAQAIRPFPMFNAALTPRWAPLGNSWYDSLQVKVTKRYSHGLDFTIAYTFAKELSTNGTNADVFNRQTLKGLTGGGVPQMFVTGFNYEVPKFTSNSFIRAVVGGWTIGGILQYQSGTLIGVPTSNNNLNAHTFQSTRMERIPGVPLYLKEPNCHCIDPYKDLVFNPAAWRDVPQGQWGPATPFYNDFRNPRHPNEPFSLGRRFRMRERMSLEVRAEMFNAFNRTHLANPGGAPNNATTYDSQGRLTGGFGRIDPTSTGGGLPRNGQLVGRFQW